MARKREIHPGFFKNEDMSELEPLCRLLYLGLLTLADKEGRLEDRPKKLKAEILPYDNCDGETCLSELAAKGFIIRYEVDGKTYLQINNWDKYQNPHPKETASIIPAPHQEDSKVNLGTTLEQPKDKHEEPKGESFNAIPSYTSIPSITSSLTTTGGVDARKESDGFAEVYTLYQNNIHPVASQIEADDIADMVRTYSAHWVEQAIKEAVRNSVRKLSYIKTILQRWHTSGVDEPWKEKRETSTTRQREKTLDFGRLQGVVDGGQRFLAKYGGGNNDATNGTPMRINGGSG